MARYRLDGYDGVLAFGAALREIYLRQRLGAARLDLARGGRRALLPPAAATRRGAATWSGSATGATTSAPPSSTSSCSSRSPTLGPARRDPRRPLSRRARCAGCAAAGIEYRGWLPNHRVPQAFAGARVTVHVPRRPYAQALPGIPTIRVFEALACGIPLVSAPWDDVEGLFTPGEDFLWRADGAAMRAALARGAARPGAGRGARRARPAHDPSSATPARIGSTSCSRSAPRSRPSASPRSSHRRDAAERSHEDRVLRLEPALRLLERRRHLLPRHPQGARGARPRGHLPRARRLRPPAASRHRAAGLGARSWSTRPTRDGLRAGARRMPRGADLVVKASGVGVFDAELEAGVLEAAPRRRPGRLLGRRRARHARAPRGAIRGDPFRALLPDYDLVLTYGGGDAGARAPIVGLGARLCAPIYNALDPDDHHPVPPRPALRRRPRLPRQPPARPRGAGRGVLPRARPRTRPSSASCSAAAAGTTSRCRRTSAGSATSPRATTTRSTAPPRCVLNVSRESMARYGWSPATRVFEAAGAGACLITDRWRGIEMFLEPGREVLVARRRRRGRGRSCAALDAAEARRDRRRGAARACSPSTPIAQRALAVEDALARAAAAPRLGAAGEGGLMTGLDDHRPRPLDHLVLGQRPRHDLARAAARRWRRAAIAITFLERDVPWYRAHRDLPQASWCRIALYRRPRRAAAALRGQRSPTADVVVVGSYVPDGVAVARWVQATRGRRDRVLRHRHAGDARQARARRPRVPGARADPGLRPLPLVRRRAVARAARADASARAARGRSTARSIPRSTGRSTLPRALRRWAISAPTAPTASRPSSACCSSPRGALPERAVRGGGAAVSGRPRLARQRRAPRPRAAGAAPARSTTSCASR